MPTETRASFTFVADTDPMADNLASIRLAVHLKSCRVCREYLNRRGNVLLVAINGRALTRGTSSKVLLDHYVQKVHTRHLAGESLSTRVHTATRRLNGATRITVQRVCNGCQKSLGDARDDELAGGRLPDVRLECGCWTEDAA